MRTTNHVKTVVILPVFVFEYLEEYGSSVPYQKKERRKDARDLFECVHRLVGPFWNSDRGQSSAIFVAFCGTLRVCLTLFWTAGFFELFVWDLCVFGIIFFDKMISLFVVSPWGQSHCRLPELSIRLRNNLGWWTIPPNVPKRSFGENWCGWQF